MAALLVVLQGAACNNTSVLSKRSTTSKSSSSASPTPAPSLIISNVNIAASSESTTSTSYETTILFNASTSASSVTELCDADDQESGTCVCNFSWNEINDRNGGTAVTVPRNVQTALTSTQDYQVTCKAPSPYASEIPDGTTIHVSVGPSNTFDYVKNPVKATGSFQDAEGRAFDNIYRYTCYSRSKRGMKIYNRIDDQTLKGQTEADSRDLVFASRFCIVYHDGTVTADAEACKHVTGVTENSAQSYYFNLYIRNTDAGHIERSNNNYICPVVREALDLNQSAPGYTSDNTRFWPMDTSFALALNQSGDFTVGIEAPSKLSNTNQATSTGTGCSSGSGSSSGTVKANNIIRSCLGFAAKPNRDGTCPTFSNSLGKTQPTYRLRRYITVYPPRYETDGKRLNEPQPVDYIYVLDRPVQSSADSLKPYTMKGPKPCPFAFFDTKAVTAQPSASYPDGMPSYLGTNASKWQGVNVDGIEFPNIDIPNQSCSAAIPLFNKDTNRWSIATVNKANPAMKHLYIRPTTPWASHYEEDTSFQACAPQASPVMDPPLHFARDPTTNNISWCAEVYPSQNPYVEYLDKKVAGVYPGLVTNFTSHVVKNSDSPKCTPQSLSIIPGSYPARNATGACLGNNHPAGAAWHLSTDVVDLAIQSADCAGHGSSDGANCYYCAEQTCDRTVQFSTIAAGDARFPLLAKPAEVESALMNDSSFACTVTYDANNGKTGISTPSRGCCGAVHLYSGTGVDLEHTNRTAHWEPRPKYIPGSGDQPVYSCSPPDY